MIEITIISGDKTIYPTVSDGVNLETISTGTPGKLEFSVVGDINFEEGDKVIFKKDGVTHFLGYIFTIKTDKSEKISVTAYDQLRYFKNKDTYVYANKTASNLLSIIAADFKLKTGVIEDTGFVIVNRIEEDKTLFDIVQNALDITYQNTGKKYVFYDSGGALNLKSQDSLGTTFLISAQNAEDFSYATSIDKEVYNKVKLVYEDKRKNKRAVYIKENAEKMAKWGVLQYFKKIDETVNGNSEAESLLNSYCKKAKNLSLKNVLGDISLRGGFSVNVLLRVKGQDIPVKMTAESVNHNFEGDSHLMDIVLTGGDFVA